MFTKAEKGYLALTLFFLASGSCIKIWRHAHARIGPFPDPESALAGSFPVPDSARPGASGIVNDSSSLAGLDSLPVGRGHNRSAFGKSDRESGGQPSGKSAFIGKVNLNRAEAVELTHVKGIGEKTAEAIVAYRRAHGPFGDLHDLLQVKGIGEKKLEKLTPYLIL